VKFLAKLFSAKVRLRRPPKRGARFDLIKMERTFLDAYEVALSESNKLYVRERRAQGSASWKAPGLEVERFCREFLISNGLANSWRLDTAARLRRWLVAGARALPRTTVFK
jgi:hypothetical protein